MRVRSCAWASLGDRCAMSSAAGARRRAAANSVRDDATRVAGPESSAQLRDSRSAERVDARLELGGWAEPVERAIRRPS